MSKNQVTNLQGLSDPKVVWATSFFLGFFQFLVHFDLLLIVEPFSLTTTTTAVVLDPRLVIFVKTLIRKKDVY